MRDTINIFVNTIWQQIICHDFDTWHSNFINKINYI